MALYVMIITNHSMLTGFEDYFFNQRSKNIFWKANDMTHDYSSLKYTQKIRDVASKKTQTNVSPYSYYLSITFFLSTTWM